MKTTFILLTEDNSGLPIALKLEDEGHKVLYACKPKTDDKHPERTLKIGDGLLQNKVSWNELTNKPPKDAIIIFDMNHHPELADKYRNLGYTVLGSGSFAYELEENRKYGLELMNQAGILTPNTYGFKNVNEALKFLENPPDENPYVFKPDKEEAWMTFVSKDHEQMKKWIEKFAPKIKKGFLLQEVVEGIEISVEMWFNGKDAILYDATLERKRRSNDDEGRNTGCAGDVVWKLNGNERIIQEGINKSLPFFRKNKLPMMIDLNCIVNDDGLWGLEWTPRFGYDASFSLFQLLKIPLGSVLERLVKGEDILMDYAFSSDFALSIRILRDMIEPELPIEIKPTSQHEGKLWWWDIVMGQDGLETGGSGEEIVIITTQAPTIDEAKKIMYEDLEPCIIIPDGDKRTDIGVKAKEDYENLKMLGWLTGKEKEYAVSKPSAKKVHVLPAPPNSEAVGEGNPEK